MFNGQYGVVTDDNGLYYMRARYYNVDIKRFINQDVVVGTIERISSLNRYSYVEGNPVSYLDPFGLERFDTDMLRTGLLIASILISTIAIVIALTVGTFALPVAIAAISLAQNLITILSVSSYIYDIVYADNINERSEAIFGLCLSAMGLGLSNILGQGLSTFIQDEVISRIYDVISDLM